MLGGLLARVLGGDLSGIRRRLAAALEAHHPGRRPGDGVALRVGDGDHRVVEAGVHVRDAGGDVLALAAAEALRFTGHFVTFLTLYPLSAHPEERLSEVEVESRRTLFLLAGDRLG